MDLRHRLPLQPHDGVILLLDPQHPVEQPLPSQDLPRPHLGRGATLLRELPEVWAPTGGILSFDDAQSRSDQRMAGSKFAPSQPM